MYRFSEMDSNRRENYEQDVEKTGSRNRDPKHRGDASRRELVQPPALDQRTKEGESFQRFKRGMIRRLMEEHIVEEMLSDGGLTADQKTFGGCESARRIHEVRCHK